MRVTVPEACPEIGIDVGLTIGIDDKLSKIPGISDVGRAISGPQKDAQGSAFEVVLGSAMGWTLGQSATGSLFRQGNSLCIPMLLMSRPYFALKEAATATASLRHRIEMRRYGGRYSLQVCHFHPYSER